MWWRSVGKYEQGPSVLWLWNIALPHVGPTPYPSPPHPEGTQAHTRIVETAPTGPHALTSRAEAPVLSKHGRRCRLQLADTSHAQA